MVYESPVNCHLCTKFKNIFNLSATYTRESDFSSLYWTDSGLYWKDENIEDSFHFSSIPNDNKRKMAAALISNCLDRKNDWRLKFIGILKRFIPVNIYGKCGKPCPSNVVLDCREYIANNYKFFLLFENTHCRDYITEKLFDTIKYNVLPIVLGGGDYTYYLPKAGYINALDFRSAQELTNYLIYLNNNHTAYNEYFKWKKFISYNENHPRMGFLCEMCIQLHLEDYLGEIKRKSLDLINRRFHIYLNCKQISMDSNTNFYKAYDQFDSFNYTYFMSPEN